MQKWEKYGRVTHYKMIFCLVDQVNNRSKDLAVAWKAD